MWKYIGYFNQYNDIYIYIIVMGIYWSNPMTLILNTPIAWSQWNVEIP